MIPFGEHHIELTPADTFTSRSFDVVVPEEARRIAIDWSYEPRRNTDPAACRRIAEREMDRYLPDPVERKALFDYHVGSYDGLGNQICYTLFSRGEFRGCEIRCRKAGIEADRATDGFLPGVPVGPCTIVLSVFCVYTDRCDVHFRFEYE